MEKSGIENCLHVWTELVVVVAVKKVSYHSNALSSHDHEPYTAIVCV